MPISFKCSECGRGLKAPDAAAGRTLKCVACSEPLIVPAAEIDPLAILLGSEEAPQKAFAPEPDDPPEPVPPPPRRSVIREKPKPDLAALPPLTSDEPPFWRRHLHWLLVLAMLPLAITLLAGRSETDLAKRLTETLADAPPDVQLRFIQAAESGATLDELIELLPEKRVKGAWLSRSTMAHWGFAAVATTLFLVFFMFLASDGSAIPLHVVLVGLFTATIGVGTLLLVQVIASFTEGGVVVGNPIVMVIYAIFRFIAFSYNAAMDPENGFLLSFVGFTLGVGLCEELVKSVPLFRHRRKNKAGTWRGLFIWGLASGAGFGIAEGLMYSSRYYNGITGSGIYLVRFVSCVALHAIWSGSVAITLYLRRDWFNKAERWRDCIAPTLIVIAMPMFLHGLYDTSLKRDMNWLALLVAAASFGWLAFLSSRLYGRDDEAANAAMLKEYQRRRKAIA